MRKGRDTQIPTDQGETDGVVGVSDGTTGALAVHTVGSALVRVADPGEMSNRQAALLDMPMPDDIVVATSHQSRRKVSGTALAGSIEGIYPPTVTNKKNQLVIDPAFRKQLKREITGSHGRKWLSAVLDDLSALAVVVTGKTNDELSWAADATRHASLAGRLAIRAERTLDSEAPRKTTETAGGKTGLDGSRLGSRIVHIPIDDSLDSVVIRIIGAGERPSDFIASGGIGRLRQEFRIKYGLNLSDEDMTVKFMKWVTAAHAEHDKELEAIEKERQRRGLATKAIESGLTTA